jgi:hypothetical protein
MKQDKEAVKVLALAVGVREAARQLSIPENTILSWSKRDGWFANGQRKPKSLPGPARNQSAITASDALRSTLIERSNATKLGLSKAAAKAAEHLGDSMPEMILAQSDRMHNVAKTASLVHGWEAGSRDTGPFSPQSIQILSQRTYLNVPPGEE